MSEIAIALNRFGLGARADTALPRNPKADLLDQLRRFDPAPATVAARPDTSAMVAQYAEALRKRREVRRMRMEGETDDAMAQQQRRSVNARMRDELLASAAARLQAAIGTDTPFPERLVHFWSNHFAISVDKPSVIGLAGAFERDAIRPHILGKFGDMLRAAVKHPGMLLYLDQVQSIGPNSRFGERVRDRARRQRGLNENLAREVLELHTLGVNGGYGQADVIELAKALTGWTIGGLTRRDDEGPVGLRFEPRIHEPGSRTVVGKRYLASGANQLDTILSDLAVHPATARHLATKLARHFAGDEPPESLVDALTASYLESGGDLPTLYRTLVERPEIWEAPSRVRAPWDWLVAGARAIDLEIPNERLAYRMMMELGQPTWRPGSPAGYPDDEVSWAGSDALMRRVEVADRLARNGVGVDPRALAEQIFPDTLNTNTADAIRRAESEQQGIALLLVSPEMMRR